MSCFSQINMKLFASAWALLGLASAINYTPKQLQHEVLGLPGLPSEPSFKMFSGYVPVGNGKEIFYWSTPLTAPDFSRQRADRRQYPIESSQQTTARQAADGEHQTRNEKLDSRQQTW
jgi:hypothetical protein